MVMALRYALIFFLPIAFAFLLQHLTWPTQLQLRDQASEILNLPGPRDFQGFLERTQRLDWLFRTYVALGAVAFSLLIPVRAATSHGPNLLTAMVLGYLVAKSLFRFHNMGWGEFGLCIAIGVAGSVAVLLMRPLQRLKMPSNG
ncbi:hypothetical protein [Frigidibacter sp.]|uniref:hypothetical protein n=1 Tax=Frigidibacter sp. TaxID=2586418 RepID=UPI002736BEFB|nr:hypothetical protein [Frigidibacter sp.]MDP3339995.1 hypothetical protein [Frigidibacter sp.]